MNKIWHDFPIKQQQPVEVIHVVAPHNPPSTRGHPTTVSWPPGRQARIEWAEQGSKTARRGREGSRSGHKQARKRAQTNYLRDHSRIFCCRALAVKWWGSYIETKPKSMQVHPQDNCYDSYVQCTLHCNPAWCIITQHNSSVRAVPAHGITIFPNIASNQTNCWGTTKVNWRRVLLGKSTSTIMLQIATTSTIKIRKGVRDCKTRDADANANAV